MESVFGCFNKRELEMQNDVERQVTRVGSVQQDNAGSMVELVTSLLSDCWALKFCTDDNIFRLLVGIFELLKIGVVMPGIGAAASAIPTLAGAAIRHYDHYTSFFSASATGAAVPFVMTGLACFLKPEYTTRLFNLIGERWDSIEKMVSCQPGENKQINMPLAAFRIAALTTFFGASTLLGKTILTSFTSDISIGEIILASAIGGSIFSSAAVGWSKCCCESKSSPSTLAGWNL